MKAILKTSLLFFIIFVFITGLIYPLLITGLAQVFFPWKANGSLIQKNGVVIGSLLLGQDFTSENYFHGRICSKEISGGSNLGPTNQTWLEKVKSRVRSIKQMNEIPDKQTIPSDLVTSSASGFDPHISKASAYMQISRVAKARHISSDIIKQVVERDIKKNSILFFSEEIVNVLQLNIALDDLQK